MSFISGLGRTDYSIPVVRSSTQSPEADFLSLSDSTVQPIALGSSSSASAQSSASSQQEQNRQEAFAKMMVTLQNSIGQVNTTNSSGSSNDLAQVSTAGGVTGTTGTKSAADDFKDYMAMTPAQKMRYGALKSMGLTEADLKALSPDAAAKVETKLAGIIKKQTEMQVAAASGSGALGSATSASIGDKGNSFLNSALVKLTQAANETTTKLSIA
ncbi:hypothetical protein QN382_10750 [Pseudomonas sp. 10B1]|uniref:hypothetical protein n=1 Tax=unclassified Pseudomonas TaxID=196821 RepID=UPI002AB47D99|nr:MULTISPECIES: hypothetical protein [unclassified Pseudomonas]MDY7560259.1 hypothetical protein [Pseudomonas sp. AB6]MEA9993889.1 hypothetical protein [Pseudomonas sp. AA4]MEB0085431.1 hypothetical protein [Pseudomonas sp. RTI1]MEB0124493.1 hypothetical protein [Pseudomonas sp. CCC1.2]MEB0152360.1 hypothetical protein [Pseudomonas sp. CCC4.3]